MRIVRGDFTDLKVLDLLTHHLHTARAETAQGSAHALDLTGLQSPNISFWSIWDDQTLAGVGALKRLSKDHGEIKSMHTAEPFRGRGVGGAMLEHLLGVARSLGLVRVSLETGSWDYFAPARSLYARHGFAPCPPFGDYRLDPNSVFMSLELKARAPGGQ